MKVAHGSGISFAIPIDMAWQVIKQLLAHGKGGEQNTTTARLVRPFVGMKMMTLTPAIIARERRFHAKGMGDGSGFDGGVLVVQVIPGSPAENGGLCVGDIITMFDGKPVHTTRHVLDRIGSEIGRPIRVRVLREGEPEELTIRTSESTSF